MTQVHTLSMASIRKRVRKDGTVAWNVLWRDADTGKQASRTLATESDAKMLTDFLNSNGQSFAEAAKTAGRMRSQAPTVDAVINRHIDSLTGVDEYTRKKYRAAQKNHITAHLGAIPVDTLTRHDVAGWVASINRAPKTQKNIHALLSAALQGAVKDGLIPSNPAKGIKIPKALPAKPPVFLTLQQTSLLLGAIEDPMIFTFCKLLLDTGLRYNEAAALRWQDVNLAGERGIIRVTRAWKKSGLPGIGDIIGPPKTTKGIRTVVMPREITSLLQAIRPAQAHPETLIFTRAGGQHLSNGYFHERIWGPLMDSIGAELGARPRPHDLRHTHASRLIERGVPLPTIQARLGHESITTTVNTYGHLAVDADLLAASALD